MRLNFVLIPLIILTFVYFSSCTSSNDLNGSKYNSNIIDSLIKNNEGRIRAHLLLINTYLIKEYNIFTFSYQDIKSKNKDSLLFFVISTKGSDETFKVKEYDSLKENKEYLLYLIKEKTPIKADFFIRGQEIYKHYYDSELFYDNGYIVAKVYKSKNINGIYILKN